MDADQLRQAFTDYFVGRGHTLVPSASLIPHHPAAPLLVNAGMVQFIPIFLGEEAPPWPTATSVQKCFRTGDVELVGHTSRGAAGWCGIRRAEGTSVCPLPTK